MKKEAERLDQPWDITELICRIVLGGGPKSIRRLSHLDNYGGMFGTIDIVRVSEEVQEMT